MNYWWKIQPNPFRFLLVAEWIMLGSCGSLAVMEAFQDQTIPVEHILILVLLGSMGLALPNGLHKLVKKEFQDGHSHLKT
jgi:hypothetical protein